MGRGNESLFLDHITKMAATHGKNTSKIFWNQWTHFQKTWYVALGFGPIIACSNDDPGLTLTYNTAWSNLVSYLFILGKMVESHLMGKVTANDQ